MFETVRILNFDESVTRQKTLLQRFTPLITDLTRIGPACRIAMNGAMASEVRRVLTPELRGAVTFLGSGDFHHVSSLLIEQFEEPLGVIVFDHHPDWDILPPKLHCGSWVTNVLRRPNIKKVVLLGVSSEDISCPWIHSGNLRALEHDRVEIYPYAHAPTRTFLRRVPENRSIHVERGFLSNTISWTELGKHPMTERISQVLERLKPTPVYVSIDKDCLKPDASLTNWEGGCFELDELLRLLDLIRRQLQVIGLDIVGDYSPPQVQGRFKAFCARLDRPQNFSAKAAPESLITGVNERTNLRILELLRERL